LLVGLVLLSATTFGIGTAVAASGGALAHPEYTLGSGDVVKVTVFGQDDLSGEFTVDGQGMVSLPLIGNIKIGGLTVRQAEKTVVGKLKPDYLKNPRVSVEVLNYRPFYIIGEVKKPGSYPYVSGMTVINAVALGGGFTYRARENDLLIIRATDAQRRKQHASQDTAVLPGDVIEVPERYF
jgi:polysaccharide export outer membrane protein